MILLRTVLGTLLLGMVALYDGGIDLPGLAGNSAVRPGQVYAASDDHTSLRLLKEVLPDAETFSEKSGDPPVYRGYREDPETGEQVLVGYAVVTPDVPPEPNGYSGPIDTLIGIDLEGRIVGIKAIYYKESHRFTLGDFLSYRRYREQYIGKTAADRFSVGNDIDGISKATISVKAMAAGVRRTVRAVTEAYILK